MVALFPQNKVGVVILTNQNGSALTGILLNHIADRVFGSPARLER